MSNIDAAYQGSLDRVRPVLMTATIDALGFIPMTVSITSSTEVQRPLATVVIGGVVTSIFADFARPAGHLQLV
ncbi:efflux RND transporter permease subunit [Bythopirellula goksoeyrii]|uniref:Nickel and cobalt resistance protein CnrA n=1 Tax=Bythopirellula goksoeyrii TaxID=1400387 RepID=A0A5B9QA71_9BACT|nr:efflux RND transporter permease subunit [Bythopirellula goksoeyrii]QEG35877.1 Nickel and cobalt resistance protein CnrA [Bythopirellula goksoeyrii]